MSAQALLLARMPPRWQRGRNQRASTLPVGLGGQISILSQILRSYRLGLRGHNLKFDLVTADIAPIKSLPVGE
jgi:hypothetical protein